MTGGTTSGRSVKRFPVAAVTLLRGSGRHVTGVRTSDHGLGRRSDKVFPGTPLRPAGPPVLGLHRRLYSQSDGHRGAALGPTQAGPPCRVPAPSPSVSPAAPAEHPELVHSEGETGCRGDPWGSPGGPHPPNSLLELTAAATSEPSGSRAGGPGPGPHPRARGLGAHGARRTVPRGVRRARHVGWADAPFWTAQKAGTSGPLQGPARVSARPLLRRSCRQVPLRCGSRGVLRSETTRRTSPSGISSSRVGTRM